MIERRNGAADEAAKRTKRPVGAALWRGFRCTCPNCGEKSLFRAFLKPVTTCTHCGEDLSHQRSDDAPAYFTMVIVGHIVVPLILFVAMNTELSNVTHLLIWLPLTLVMALSLLQPIKGATIAMQWALYMHGFAGAPDRGAHSESFAPRDSG
jgi:uncharacterized protein (DUF983 family)